MFKMGLHDPFGYFKHKLWPKEKLEIALISFCAGSMPYTVGKILTRAITFL